MNTVLILGENLQFQTNINSLLLEIIRLNSQIETDKAKYKEEENKLKHQNEILKQENNKLKHDNEILKRENERLKYQKIFDFRKPYFACKTEQRNTQRSRIKEAILIKCRHFLKVLGLSISSIKLIRYDSECETSIVIIDDKKEQAKPKFTTSIVVRMLYCKVKCLISDHAWRMMRRYSRDEFPNCPSVKALKKYQKQLNEKIKITSVDNGKGAYVDVLERISSKLRLVVKTYKIQPTEKLIVKVSADTFNTLKTKVLAITFTVINEINKCKAARGSYVLGLFKVNKENYQITKHCFDNCFKNVSESFNSINIDGNMFEICIVYCCDMKMALNTIGNLGASSKHPCLICCVEKSKLDSAELFPKRVFPEKIGENSHARESFLPTFIPKENIIVDVFHMETRVSEMIINAVIKELFYFDNITESTKSFDATKHLSLKRYVEFLKNLKIVYDFSTSESNKLLSGRSLTGKEVRKIITNLKIEDLLPNLDNKESFQKLIDDLNTIMLKLRNNLITADDLKKNTLKWLELHKKIQFKSLVTPYMHILVHHVPEMVKRFNGIHQFTLEGAEKKNHTIKVVIFRATNLREPYVMVRVLQLLHQSETLFQMLEAAGDYQNEDNPKPKSVFNKLKNDEFHKTNNDVSDIDMIIDNQEIIDYVADAKAEEDLQGSNISLFSDSNGNEWAFIEFFQILKKQHPMLRGLCDPRILYENDYVPSIEYDQTIFVFNTSKPTGAKFGSHWVVVTNIGCDDDCWRIYDSAGTQLHTNENIKTFMQKLYQGTNQEILRIEIPSVQMQSNEFDSCLFAFAFVQTLAEKRDPSIVHYKQNEMREHYNTIIRDEKISAFPFFSRKKCLRKSVYSTFEIKLK